MGICYIGKATKIFIFIVALLLITGLVIGFGLFRHPVRRSNNNNNNSCSGQSVDPSCFPDPNSTTPTATAFNRPPTAASASASPPPPPPEVVPPPPPPVVVPGAPAPGLSPPTPSTTPAPTHARKFLI